MLPDIPDYFPWYCRDLKQILDEKAESTQMECEDIYDRKLPRWKNNLILIQRMEDYPKQNNEHNALDDAKWNFELYKFLKQL